MRVRVFVVFCHQRACVCLFYARACVCFVLSSSAHTAHHRKRKRNQRKQRLSQKVSESRYCGRLDVTAVGNARQPDRVLVLKNHPLNLREIQIHLFIRRWPPYHLKAPDRVLDVEIVLEAPPITFEF